MDYSRMGKARAGSNKPRHDEHNAKGTRKNPYGSAPDKSALLARMKAAVVAKKNETP